MDIPRSNREGSREICQDGMGSCPKCGMLKMSIAGVKKCPSCDTKSETRSGLTNNIKSVPQSAFKKVKKKGLDGKPYYDMVAKTKKEMQMGLKLQDKEGASSSTFDPLNGAKEKLEVVSLDQVMHTPITDIVDPVRDLSRVSNYFDGVPTKDIASFKKVDKLRKAIKKLRTQIEEYLLGGK